MFWDSSAIIPYLVREDRSSDVTELLSSDDDAVIWWATPVECVSALERRRREGKLADDAHREAVRRLRETVDSSVVVQAVTRLRKRAERLLAMHALRSADALQLAAALIWCEEAPGGEGFVCLDERLREAARREGFDVEPGM